MPNIRSFGNLSGIKNYTVVINYDVSNDHIDWMNNGNRLDKPFSIGSSKWPNDLNRLSNISDYDCSVIKQYSSFSLTDYTVSICRGPISKL